MNKSTIPSILKAAILAAPMLAPVAAIAEPAQEWRCSTDSLAPTPALQRLEWARKCGLTTNTGGPGSSFDSPAAVDMLFNPARDYRELNAAKAFTGSLNDYNVNYYYAYGRYMPTFQYTVTQEVLGPTTGYWKWAHSSQRPRPLYPSFENTPVAGSGTQLYPHPTLANCNLYTDTGGVNQFTGSTFVIAYCESSCYTPDQNLRFADGDVNIVKAMKAKRDDVVTLSPDATLDNLHTQTSKVFSYTTEVRDSEHVIFRLTTASGGKLSVTNEHPMITSEGRLVKAANLVAGDELLKANGTPDAITKIEKTTHFGKVYNIKPASLEPVANVVIAQGYLIGSARFQNDDVEYMNRILLFRGVPEAAMPR